MKGPRARWKYDLRRVWECPRCRKRHYTTGQVVQRLCTCGGAGAEPQWMSLVEEQSAKKSPALEDKGQSDSAATK
jgi:hypothetical protein